ncbi:hypothetical protein Fmac_002598 [Flemingia macrophylla]|uniref:Uncharacterized protein n=1 Tax=Flemingia macrophylla TaxID=520843 RepID=A0ABD1NKD3_9FABA
MASLSVIIPGSSWLIEDVDVLTPEVIMLKKGFGTGCERSIELMMKGQCMPRLKGNNSCKTNKPPSPITLLERFREAVLRLMMISALSKPTTNHRHGDQRHNPRHHINSPHDPHHTEAVADCIEFIKKKAATDAYVNTL